MSYAGLLSLVYAKLTADDPRVKGVLEWLGNNYTLEENPGLGAQGLYYYFHAMTKALAAAGIEKLPLGDGKNRRLAPRPRHPPRLHPETRRLVDQRKLPLVGKRLGPRHLLRRAHPGADLLHVS